jgi:hypothetical protein
MTTKKSESIPNIGNLTELSQKILEFGEEFCKTTPISPVFPAFGREARQLINKVIEEYKKEKEVELPDSFIQSTLQQIISIKFKVEKEKKEEKLKMQKDV